MKIIHLFPHTLNLGDYFVKMGIQKLLSEVLSGMEYTPLPASSKIPSKNNGKGGITKETIDILNQSDLIIIGGSNLYETIEHNQLEVELDALEQVNKPVLLIGIGSGWSSVSPRYPRLSEIARSKICLLEQKSCGHSVRDHFTQRLLWSYGIRNAVVTGCPAAYLFEGSFRYQSSGRVYITGLPYRMYTERTFDPRIARWRHSYQRRRKATTGYIKMLKLLDKEKIDYNIFITDYRDIPVAEKILGSDERIIFDESPDRLLSYLEDCSLMIGYRLHALIPALSWGIPVIPVPLDGRISGFIETYGFTEFSVNPYDPQVQSLIFERVKLALEMGRGAWEPTIVQRDRLGVVMRDFVSQSLANIGN